MWHIANAIEVFAGLITYLQISFLSLESELSFFASLTEI